MTSQTIEQASASNVETPTNPVDISTKKTKFQESYAVAEQNDLDSVHLRIKDKYRNPHVKKASLVFKVSTEANPTEKIPAKITARTETYLIENVNDVDAFMQEASKVFKDDDILLKTASIAFKMDIDPNS